MIGKTLNYHKADGLIFGIYPGGWLDSFVDKAIPDTPQEINKALNTLQLPDYPFVVRGYVGFEDGAQSLIETPSNMIQYTCNGRKLGLTLCYRSKTGDLDGWKDFICKTIQAYGHHLAKIQLTEEPNNPDPNTGGDGSSPNIYQAIVEGVCTAKEEIDRLNLDCMVGFNAVISFNPLDVFWKTLADAGTSTFLQSLDYVGLDFFPDVFVPLPLTPDGTPFSMEDAVTVVLEQFRNGNLHEGKIPFDVPIHITENGWPTNPARSEERQAEILETTVETIYRKRAELNITHYEYFDLRDANSSESGLQFGLLHDDYTPKPAFDTFCRLIQKFGNSHGTTTSNFSLQNQYQDVSG
ncbi:hypothetical protein [Runella sp.]|uniref:hypothetical protein n=1 Tax=Runella sp. TaxID=1960881 RepID=UPI003D112009